MANSQVFDSRLIAKIAKVALNCDFGAADGLSFHSGRVKIGDAFFALPGADAHGIRFADQALAKGARFIVSDKYHERGILVADPAQLLLDLGQWARAQLRGKLIAVTGSAGKTSTKTFIANALNIPKSPGNFNTPLALAKTLIEQVISGQTNSNLVLELGIDHKGEMDILLNLSKPDYGVLTLISESHLLGLGSLEIIASEKKKLLGSAKKSFVSHDAMHFVNKAKNIRSYGLFPEKVDFAVKLLNQGLDGQTLAYKDIVFKIPVLSHAMAKAAAVSLALAQELNYDLTKAAKRLEGLRLEPGRLEIKRHDGFIILDDSYNSSPAAIKEALRVLASLPKPHTAILGDMLELGPNSHNYHRLVAKNISGLKLITIGKDAEYFSNNSNAVHFTKIKAAEEYLGNMKKEGSILVKASRGMKFENVVTILEAQQ